MLLITNILKNVISIEAQSKEIHQLYNGRSCISILMTLMHFIQNMWIYFIHFCGKYSCLYNCTWLSKWSCYQRYFAAILIYWPVNFLRLINIGTWLIHQIELKYVFRVGDRPTGLSISLKLYTLIWCKWKRYQKWNSRYNK